MNTNKLWIPVLILSAIISVFPTYALAQETDALSKVADAIMSWDGQNPGDLFMAVKQANPDKPAIVSMRELNKAFADKRMPAPIADNSAAIIQKQKAAQQSVRGILLSAREATYSRYRSSNPEAFRSIYGYGDIGSWPNAAVPDASMDIDCTVLGTDRNVTAALRNDCQEDLLRQLTGDDSKLTLADFDIVITAEGHEVAAGVFETEGGIDWAKRNMKRVTIVQPDGTTRTFQLTAGGVDQNGRPVGSDPVGEMAQAEHMAKFRDLASKGGDYLELFDKDRGFLKKGIFDDPNNTAAQALWNKYMDSLSDFGIDYYRSRSSTATGGCLDMAKHLQEEVITKKHVPQAKLKKTLKYVSRADNISRGVPGLDKLLASDPLLSDPAYKDIIDLSKQIAKASDAQVEAIIQERCGDMPDAGLQELGAKARRAILRMSEVAFQAEMDRIILELPDKAQRKTALDKLTDDFRIVSEEGGEYSDLANSAVEQIAKVQDANEAGTIDALKNNYQSLEKIRQSEQGLISKTVDFLKQTKLGSKMLEKGGKLLELGKQPVFDPMESKYRSSAMEFIGDVADQARTQNLKVVEILSSAAMWVEVVDDVRKANNNADLAIALSKTLVNNTFFGMVLNSAYAGIVMGDNDALGKAIMYMLVPEAALPALVEALGNTVINMTAQTLFDAQMDAVYKATTWNEDGTIKDFSGLGMAGDEGAKYFVDTMCDGASEEVAQDIISRSKATEAGTGMNAIAIKVISKSIKSTVDNGNMLIFKEDGPLMKACAAIRKCTEDIKDCAKIWGVEVALSAANAGDLPNGLDPTQSRALMKIMEQRESFRQESRKALAAAMIRTFEERHSAEASLDGGKSNEEYDALLKMFKDLGITKEGTASLDQEGATYNLITNWTTSEREKQVRAVKAVQKFKDAYGFVLQARTSAEDAYQNNMDSGSPSPRPLTGSLPLTAKPDMDSQNARAYLAEIGPLSKNTVKDLELIKQSKLEGAYDSEMFKKLYDIRFAIAYWSNMMKAASAAQQLHWAVEILDKQALYTMHSEAAAKASELQKKDTYLQDEFRNHYVVQGEFIVELTGPRQITSGKEAKLVTTVRIRSTAGETSIVPVDIAQGFRYSWKSGKASLGEGPEAARSYKLETIGDHVFTVVVTQRLIQAGKPVVNVIGEKPWTVRVVAPPADPKKPDEKPPAEKPPADVKKPGDKATGEKPPAEKPPVVTPPPGVPTGGESPSSGTAAGGYWKLTDVRDSTSPKAEYEGHNQVMYSQCAVNVSGSTMSTRAVAKAPNFFRDQPDPKPYQVASSASWTELPKALASDATVSTTLKSEYRAGDTSDPYAQEGALARIEEKPRLRADSLSLVVGPGKPETAKWGLGKGFTDQFSADKRTIEVSHTGPGGEATRSYTYTWTSGAISNAFDVNITADTPVPKLGDTVTLSAQVTGGTAPFTYAWTGAASGSAAELPFTVSKPERYDFIIVVVDAKGAKASAAFSVEVQTLTATIKLSGGSLPVFIGQTLSFQGEVSSPDGTAPPARLVYRWQPNPEVAFTPFEGTGNTTTGRFSRMGKVKVWVDVLQPSGSVLSTVAESNQLEIEVVAPELSLTANPSTPYPGQEVRINVTMNPAIQDKYVTFWWEIQGNALNAGPVVVGDAYSRAYTYKPKDTAPVTVTVHGKAKDGGDDLGQKSLTVTAKPYEVNIGEPRLMGLPPRVWSEQEKRLVEVPGSIATFQDFFLKVNVSPTPPDPALRYEWTSQPEGCSIYSPGSQETRGNASRGGTFNIAVTVRDSQNIVLGSGERTVSIVEPTPEPKKTEPVGRQKALDMLMQAQSLYQQDKLNEALKMAEEAVNSDPANADASRYAEDLKEELQQIKQSLKTVEDLAVNGKLDEAVVELEKVKKPHPGYEDVLRFESTLQDLKKIETERTKKAEEEEKEVLAAEASASETDTGREKAADLFKQAQSLYQQDKLLEALEMADAAVNSDPANSEAGRYAKELRAELEQIIQSLNSVKDLVNQDLLSEASAELEMLVKPHPLFAKFAEYESWLQGLTKSAEEKKRVEDEEAPAAEASASEAAVKLKQAQDLIKQNRFEEAHQLASEAVQLDPSNMDASDCERSLRAHLHILKAQSLGKQGKFDEAYAEVDLVKKIDPGNQTIPKIEQWLIQQREYLNSVQKAAELKKAETVKQQAATEHLNQALSLGKAGRLDEATAEVAEAKNDDPSHSQIAEFERWIIQLRQQREAAANAADQKAAEDRAAEAQAREASAQAAAEEKKQQEPPPESQGCSLSGDWSFSEEGGAMTLSLRQSGTNLAGTLTINDPSMGSNSLTISGSMSGRDVRITGAKVDFEISFSGTVSADCRTLNVSATMEGETHATTFRRR